MNAVKPDEFYTDGAACGGGRDGHTAADEAVERFDGIVGQRTVIP